jgi:hypothetical protein
MFNFEPEKSSCAKRIASRWLSANMGMCHSAAQRPSVTRADVERAVGKREVDHYEVMYLNDNDPDRKRTYKDIKQINFDSVKRIRVVFTEGKGINIDGDVAYADSRRVRPSKKASSVEIERVVDPLVEGESYTCDICGSGLTKWALITNKGVMGVDCYRRLTGRPVPRQILDQDMRFEAVERRIARKHKLVIVEPDLKGLRAWERPDGSVRVQKNLAGGYTWAATTVYNGLRKEKAGIFLDMEYAVEAAEAWLARWNAKK